ncbi:MAG: RNA-binding S4 domain-containing protein [Saprospirales bacterium]|nr:MAG: RNA-binding S4 domain-containing protein [Saprospirales bacterium]
MDKVRVDKWLWSVRILKTRSLATKFCKEGKVSKEDQKLKPSSTVSIGDKIELKKDGFSLVFKVVKLLEKRVGAPLAVECYTDLTTAEEYQKYESWFNYKKKAEYREKGRGRPTKKERREIEKFKGGIDSV